MQRTMQDLSEGVFISMANLTLARRDSYLEFIRGGVKPDTLTALCPSVPPPPPPPPPPPRK